MVSGLSFESNEVKSNYAHIRFVASELYSQERSTCTMYGVKGIPTKSGS